MSDHHALHAISLIAVLFTATVHAESRRAVLIGINTYNPTSTVRARLTAASAKVAVSSACTAEVARLRGVSPNAAFKRPSADGKWTDWQYENLFGAVADARLTGDILSSLSFEAPVTLYNEQATADAILKTLWKELVCEAAPGDIRVVYYSGHGSYVINQASRERDRHDQTMVPADHWNNTPDVRDKELSRILYAAGKKHVIVTLIADSCHSGSIARGGWNNRGRVKTARDTNARPVVVNDPADIDPNTTQPIEPKDWGVVVISAAQSNEEALESSTDNGKHGAFTWALKQAIQGAPSQRIDLLFQRTAALLKANGFLQEPVLEANQERLSKGLFGQSVDGVDGLVVTADSVNNGVIRLHGGTAIGIYQDCQLKRLASISRKPPLEIKVTRVVGAALSEAAVIEKGGGATVEAGDQFQVDQWVVPSEAMLKVYVPKPAPAQTILDTVAEISRLKGDSSIAWLFDATLGNPTHVMSWDGVRWILEQSPARGQPVPLGPAPSAATVRKHLPAGATFLLLIPPTTGLVNALRVGRSRNSNVDVLSSPDGAHYWLEGRTSGNAVEFAWVLPDSTEDSVRAKIAAKDSAMALPIRSDWVVAGHDRETLDRAGASLTEKALRLGRVRAWLTLRDPASTFRFPYHLALENVQSKRMITTGEMRGGSRYKLYLRAEEKDLQRLNREVAPRWVYIFAMDHFGKGWLLFPPLGHGNDGNQFPHRPDADSPPEVLPLIPVNGYSDYDFEVGEPYGIDTYLLLSTEQPILNREIFEFDGARSKGSERGVRSGDALTELLSSVGASTRGPARSVPSEWSLERLTLRSVPAK